MDNREEFDQWFCSADYRQKYQRFSPAYLAAEETWYEMRNGAWLLRKQAEAVIDVHNEMSDSFVLEATGAIQERAILRCQDFLFDFANRLRQQADELERNL